MDGVAPSAVWRAAYDDACQKFAAGVTSQIDFAIQLDSLGFTTLAIQAEIALHHPPSPGRPT